MDAAAELGRNPVSKHQIQPEYGDEQADAGRDCRTRLARPNSQARTTGKYSFSLLSADHEQDRHLIYLVDPYSCYCIRVTTRTYMYNLYPPAVWFADAMSSGGTPREAGNFEISKDSRDSSRFPRRRPSIYSNRHTRHRVKSPV